MSELLSYKYILDDLKEFKKSGTSFGNDFNITDTPSQKYFKILFYFGSEPEFANDSFDDFGGSGLLAPTWEIINPIVSEQDSVNGDYSKLNNKDLINSMAAANNKTESSNVGSTSYYLFNSAWAFLKMNDENERAEKLEHFVRLLSDISSQSPWYFTSVSGVQEALERKFTEDGKLDMNERKKLTINCLPDAFDNRIGTLLELYRDITWSWIHKKEIIPANLRKFDMAIYIFETPERNWYTENDTIDSVDESTFKIGYKMIEFHDCEFNYNSVKTAWNELNNQTGISPTYQIEISYNDCYEISYNDMLMRKIGDVILTDLINASKNDSAYESNAQVTDSSQRNLLKERLYPSYESKDDTIGMLTDKVKDIMNMNGRMTFGNLSNRKGSTGDIKEQYEAEYEAGFIGNAIGQAVGHAKAWVKGKINRALMGNLFTFSLTQMADQAKDLLGGNLIKTGMSIAQYVKEANARKDAKNKEKPNGDIFPEPEPREYRKIGNLYSGSSIANNL